VRIDRVSKTNTPPATAKARPVTPSSSSQQSFNESAEEAARAFANPDDYRGGDGLPEREKGALSSIDDIAARASLNIVERKPMDTRSDPGERQA
jgi:hypothetical protein